MHIHFYGSFMITFKWIEMVLIALKIYIRSIKAKLYCRIYEMKMNVQTNTYFDS